MQVPVTLYLIGFAGSGKYTIAKEIAKSADYKIVDNHLINNPIFSLLDMSEGQSIPMGAWMAICAIRKAVLHFVSIDHEHNYVFTNELLKNDVATYKQVQDCAAMRESLFVPVKLVISPEEHRKRIVSIGRKERFKSTNIAEINSGKELIDINHQNALTLDVTDLTAQQAAKQILDFVAKLSA